MMKNSHSLASRIAKKLGITRRIYFREQCNQIDELCNQIKTLEKRNNYLSDINVNTLRLLSTKAEEPCHKEDSRSAKKLCDVAIVNANTYLHRSNNLYADILETTCGNTGNSYIGQYLIDCISEHHNVINIQNNIFLDDAPTVENVSGFQYVVFSFQDFLKDGLSYVGNIDPFNNWISILRSTDVIPIVIGIGVNTFDGTPFPRQCLNSLVELLKQIDRMGGLICTRCNATTSYLYSLGINNAVATGCPSYFAFESDPRPNISSINSLPVDQLSVAVNGIFYSNNLSEAKLFPVLQDEPGFLRLLSNSFAPVFSDLAYNLDMSHGYTMMILNSIKSNRLQIYGNLSEAASFYSTTNIAIGSRVHGAIASLNGGTPAIVTNGDFRSKSMCDFLCIPHAPEWGFGNPDSRFGENVTWNEITEKINAHDWDEHVNIRKKRALFFKQAMISKGIEVNVLKPLRVISPTNIASEYNSTVDFENSSSISYLLRNIR